jgi:hypothetical protein
MLLMLTSPASRYQAILNFDQLNAWWAH